MGIVYRGRGFVGVVHETQKISSENILVVTWWFISAIDQDLEETNQENP